MIGFWQILIVLAIVILIFGPSRIEGLGGSLGKAIKAFKKGASEAETSSDDTQEKEKSIT